MAEQSKAAALLRTLAAQADAGELRQVCVLGAADGRMSMAARAVVDGTAFEADTAAILKAVGAILTDTPSGDAVPH